MHLTPIGNGQILLEPGEALDPSNPDLYLTVLADFLQQHNARCLLYDLKAIPIIDSIYRDWLEMLNALCHVVRIKMVVVNMQPAAAYALAIALDKPPTFHCARDVNSTR
jgi:rsbT antagonist protein RsbS